MKNKIEVNSDFIMEAYKSACSDWKKRIEDELPDLFRLTGGTWKVNTAHQNALVFYLDNSQGKETYAIHHNNGYSGKNAIRVVNSYNYTLNDRDQYRDATLEDFLSVLATLVRYPENFLFNSDQEKH